MPATGKFFTAQSPLGPIFLAGLVSVKEAERAVVRNWFCTVTARGSKSVSSSASTIWRKLGFDGLFRVFRPCGIRYNKSGNGWTQHEHSKQIQKLMINQLGTAFSGGNSSQNRFGRRKGESPLFDEALSVRPNRRFCSNSFTPT
jgi:hypothetical protein